MIVASPARFAALLGRGLHTLAACLAIGATFAQAVPGAASGAPRFDPVALEAVIDASMADQFERHAIAGASVAIVHAGEVVLAKGYGYADLAAGTPVDPDTTLFAVGSVTKLLTWLAVMQLVEQGSLDLQADVNDYLTRLEIPATFGEPVRLWHLLSHTAGFEDRPVVGLFSRSAAGLPSLEQALADSMPARLWESGRYAAYSNYSSALAAQIVSEVSGMPWEDYLETRILGPLGMEHATTRQPVPEHLAGGLSRVYASHNGDPVEEQFEFVPLAPAGALTVSASDMARFMLAHLQDGRLGEARVLGEETARQMRTRLFSHDPSLPGNAYGFWEGVANGQRYLGHGGDTMLSHALLVLLPNHDLGLFVAYNSADGGAARTELWRAFVDHLFPRLADRAAAPTPQPAGLERFAGSYATNRVAANTIGKLGALFDAIVVSLNDGALVLRGGGDPLKLTQLGPNEFLAPDGDTRVLFREDARGNVSHLFVSETPMVVATPTAWHARLVLHGSVLAGGLLLFVSAALIWTVLALLRRRRAAPMPLPSRFARRWGIATGLVFLVFYLLFALAMRNPFDIVYGLTPLLTFMLVLGVVAAVMAAVMALLAVVVWRRGHWSLLARLHYTLVALAGLALVWQLDYWNALGIRI